MSSSRMIRAFTILELLIVLAVFGLFATLGVISLNDSRARMRDSLRVSDVSYMRAALSQYWLEQATYPSSQGTDLGGGSASVLSAGGITAAADAKQPVYIQQLPVGPKSNEFYHYQGGSDGYSLRFQTETNTVYGKPGVYYAHASGVDTVDADK